VQKFNELRDDERKKIEDLAKEANAYLIQMSNITGDGIQDVKTKACDILLDHRLTQKTKDPKKEQAIMNRLHVAQPKKRDDIERPVNIPQTVIDGVKRTGPTVKELQEEFGGAGNFYIPIEDHYQLEKEEWRYDEFPEFYNGSNVLDFYDPDIEKKLAKLEKEEAEILKLEQEENELMEGEDDGDLSENSEGITMDDLKRSLKEVRKKKEILRLQHKLKAKLKARPKKIQVETLIDGLESKGIEVNKESLRSRSKVRRGIKDLEAGQDRLANKIANLSDDEAAPLIDDENVANEEADTRGRKRTRKTTVNLGEFMDVDEDSKSAGKFGRSMTPAQRHISAQKIIRSKTQERREGSTPKRLPYKLVPEEQVRLAKKITSKRFKNSVQVNEADRHIAVKKPKHLYAGKMSNGTRNKR